jgi:hypothetical protein
MFVFGGFATRVLQLQTRKHGEVVVDHFLVFLEEVAVRLARFVGVSNFVWSCPRNNLGRLFFGFLWVPTFWMVGLEVDCLVVDSMNRCRSFG